MNEEKIICKACKTPLAESDLKCPKCGLEIKKCPCCGWSLREKKIEGQTGVRDKCVNCGYFRRSSLKMVPWTPTANFYHWDKDFWLLDKEGEAIKPKLDDEYGKELTKKLSEGNKNTIFKCILFKALRGEDCNQLLDLADEYFNTNEYKGPRILPKNFDEFEIDESWISYFIEFIIETTPYYNNGDFESILNLDDFGEQIRKFAKIFLDRYIHTYAKICRGKLQPDETDSRCYSFFYWTNRSYVEFLVPEDFDFVFNKDISIDYGLVTALHLAEYNFSKGNWYDALLLYLLVMCCSGEDDERTKEVCRDIPLREYLNDYADKCWENTRDDEKQKLLTKLFSLQLGFWDKQDEVERLDEKINLLQEILNTFLLAVKGEYEQAYKSWISFDKEGVELISPNLYEVTDFFYGLKNKKQVDINQIPQYFEKIMEALSKEQSIPKEENPKIKLFSQLENVENKLR
ncbi:MAG TPA: hypothetical protein DHV62_04470, partial [Elusimicrobia bacterium]|nr:hypothetical protein [Elusimicrobiota bacterium]